MTNRIYHYYLPETFGQAELVENISKLGALQLDPSSRIQKTFFDTFDWRLHAAGSYLVEEKMSDETRLCWRKLSDDELLGQLVMDVPGFAWDFPEGELRDGLEKLIAMRALLPMAQVRLQCVRAAVLNKQQKTVLRVVLEQGWAGRSGLCDQVLTPRLRIEPVKGYHKPLQQALDLIEQSLRLEPASLLMDDALDLADRTAEDYTGKMDVQLHPEMPTGEAVRRILLNLSETIQRNLEGTRADLDSEFLHDFRVAVRRTRSLFSAVKGVLPAEALQRFRPGFKWLGQITGPTRDLDVYLLKLPGYRKKLPLAMQADLGPLNDFLLKHQKQEQRKLSRQLDSARFRRLMTEWQDFLEAGYDSFSWPEKAATPINDTANRRTWKTYRMVIKEAEAISDDSPAEALHELRISCKKLRYLMEFFQSLYPAEKIRKQVKALKSLQDNLGDFQDLEIQANALRSFGHEMQAEKEALPSDTFMAMGVLIDSLNQQQEQERRAFAERFARFARPENRRVCRELFNP
jgi:CHAD domain-containing protein